MYNMFLSMSYLGTIPGLPMSIYISSYLATLIQVPRFKDAVHIVHIKTRLN